MWFCLLDAKEFGPFSYQEAESFITSNPKAFVWKEGLAEWMPSSFFHSFHSKKLSPPSISSSFDCDLDFEIRGDDMQYVEVSLDCEQEILAEPGSLIYKQTGVELQAVLGSENKNVFSKVFGAGKRILTGENFFLTSFINQSRSKKYVAFSAPYCGKIIPISLLSFGGEVICQKQSFLCAQSNVEIGIYFQKKLSTALFGGAGFIMQSLRGQGVVFIHSSGMVSEFELEENETMQVDLGSLVAFSPTVEFNLTSAGGIKSQLFGGSGIFLANMVGPGKVWIQSLPFSKLAENFSRVILPSKKIKR